MVESSEAFLFILKRFLGFFPGGIFLAFGVPEKKRGVWGWGGVFDFLKKVFGDFLAVR